MSGYSAQLLPAICALAGVTLTLLGAHAGDRRRFYRERQQTYERQSLVAFAELLQTVTELGRVMRSLEEELEEGGLVDKEIAVRRVDDLVGQIRRQAAMARLVGPRSAMNLIVQIESELIPLHKLTVNATEAHSGIHLGKPATRLFNLRDEIADEIRRLYNIVQ
jgi:hypothetical protein